MQSSSLLFNQFSLMLSYITTVQLSKLRSKHWYNTVNWSLIWDLPVSSVTYFFFPSIQSHIVFSWYIYLVVSNQRLSLFFLHIFEEYWPVFNRMYLDLRLMISDGYIQGIRFWQNTTQWCHFLSASSHHRAGLWHGLSVVMSALIPGSRLYHALCFPVWQWFSC